MDIRRIPLWEGRNATYMSNDIINVVIEDQGEVCLELSNTCISGARVNPLSLPYFRGIGSGVLSDPNGEWYQMKQSLYQAGGSYFTFPYSSEDHITSNNTYWTVRKYGTEENYGCVWRLSEMKSREEGNRYRLEKVDLVIPGHPVLYTAIRITNTGDETLYASPSHSVMFGSPFFESGCFIDTNARNFSAYHTAVRELATNRFLSGPVFDELKKAPLVKGGFADASYVPAPTGTYDYLLGKLPERAKTGWISIINPRLQQLYISFTPADMIDSFPNIFLVENYLGRMDTPWALYDGATSQVYSLSVGMNYGPKHTKNFSLEKGRSKTLYFADAFLGYDNPRMNLGIYTVEFIDGGILLKRTKSTIFVPADHNFEAIAAVSKNLFQNGQESVSP